MAILNVLVVDDEPGIRTGIERILRNFTVGYPFIEEDFSFNTKSVETGEEALDIINNENIDIVLLDNKLPGIEGIEVLEQIKKQNIDVEVMMITSYASLDLAVKATHNGAFNFVPKPFTPQELKTEMDSIVKHLFLKRMTKKMNMEGKKVRFQFLSVLSHELKSPINAIEGYLNIMKEKQAGDNIDNYMMMINRSLDRLNAMRNLIMDLLDMTRIESGEKARNITTVDIVEIVNSVKHSMEPLAIHNNVKIEFDYDSPCLIAGDRTELEIIVNNMVSNAVKYNIKNGKVFIHLKCDSGTIKLTVEDTGIGISKEDISKLFNEFTRIRNDKTKHITGSGLGLSIVKKLVDLYNGEISVESTPDIGSKFTVLFPVKQNKTA